MVQVTRLVMSSGATCLVALPLGPVPSGEMPSGQMQASGTSFNAYGIGERWIESHPDAGQTRQPKGPAGGETG
jgi:hypothetical protein